jgi:hypothetical protein
VTTSHPFHSFIDIEAQVDDEDELEEDEEDYGK